MKEVSRHFVTCYILDQCVITVIIQYRKPNMIIVVYIDSRFYQNTPLCLHSVLLRFSLHSGIFVSADSMFDLKEIHFWPLCDSAFIFSVCSAM